MALAHVPHESELIHEAEPRISLVSDYGTNFELCTYPSMENSDSENEETLRARFGKERIGNMASEFLVKSGLSEQVGDRQFVIAIVDAESEFADLGKSIETIRFAQKFGRTFLDVYLDYEPTDSDSTFLVAIDTKNADGNPSIAGAIRFTENGKQLQKSISDLVKDDPSNPWIVEIKTNYFDQGEQYDADLAWKRLGEKEGVQLDPDDCLDVATMTVGEEYSSHQGLDGVSIGLYHSCQRYGLAMNKGYLIAIQDIGPFTGLQEFGAPFDTYSDLENHPYGGPYDTVPSFCDLKESVVRIRNCDPLVGRIFVDGEGLEKDFLLPEEYSPDKFSNVVVGL